MTYGKFLDKFNLVVCGGTFDHFHKGHESFLRFILSISEKIVLGLTSDSYIKDKKTDGVIESYQRRKKSLEGFLRNEKVLERFTIAPIDDLYYPKAWKDFPIEAIVVTKDTVIGAEKINLRRKEQGKYPLKIEIVPLIKDENNEYISSSRIRMGEIDRKGKPYLNPYWLHNDLIITKKLRKEFKKPFGRLIKDKTDFGSLTGPFIITVGDITTKIFNKLRLNQNISVVDFCVSRRKEFYSLKDLGFSDDEEAIGVNNPAGCLTLDLFNATSELFKKKRNRPIILKIDGEEDLCVLPLTLCAPLKSLIFYGQPDKGIVRVEVSEEIKERAYNFVNQFTVSTRGY